MKIKSKTYNYGPIGQRIKNARLGKGYTQGHMAELLNVSCQHISDIERGLNGMSIPMLMDICKILDVGADYILFGTVTTSGNSPINSVINKMSPEQSMYALELLEVLTKSFGIK